MDTEISEETFASTFAMFNTRTHLPSKISEQGLREFSCLSGKIKQTNKIPGNNKNERSIALTRTGYVQEGTSEDKKRHLHDLRKRV